MTGTGETRAELIERVHKAARIERAETVRRLLRTLLNRPRRAPAAGWRQREAAP